MRRFIYDTGRRCAQAAGLLALAVGLHAAETSPTTPVVPKWHRFDHEFKSSVLYSNALQEATLTVRFTSPAGETSEVQGFWDGGRTWRVRFAPDAIGRWKFRTSCSDRSNTGLHDQAGELVCSSAVGLTRFKQHGPVRVARDRRHLEHADGTPFFWLADTAWAGARLAELSEWQLYAYIRAEQQFTVAQWAAAPGQDLRQEFAFTGFTDFIAINLDYFRRLEEKVQTLGQVGLLSAIAPLLELESQTKGGARLPDDQAILLARYIVARWGADPVVWVVGFDGDKQGERVARWKKIGQAVFGKSAHAPVLLYPGQTPWLLEDFRDQTWVDILGFQTVTDLTEDSLKWSVSGPLAQEWTKTPARPLIVYAPHENAIAPLTRKRFSAQDVRQAVYYGLLMGAPAGASYGAQGVANWDSTTEPKDSPNLGADLPLWHKSLFLPAAKQMSHLGKLMGTFDFHRLRPQPRLVARQPDESKPGRHIAGASSETKDLALVYVPQDRAVDLATDALPPSPNVTWVNPRTGLSSPAVAVVGGNTCQFPTPEAGDWLLIIKGGK